MKGDGNAGLQNGPWGFVQWKVMNKPVGFLISFLTLYALGVNREEG